MLAPTIYRTRGEHANYYTNAVFSRYYTQSLLPIVYLYIYLNGIGSYHHKLKKVKLTIGNNEAISVTAVWILAAHGPKLKQINVYYMTLLNLYHQLDG